LIVPGDDACSLPSFKLWRYAHDQGLYGFYSLMKLSQAAGGRRLQADIVAGAA
jgi:hypothetical protein